MPLLRPVSVVRLLAAVMWASAVSSAACAQTPVHNPQNGHDYALIVLPNPISWEDASKAARNSEFRGRVGYLATLTSAPENTFVRTHVYKDSALNPIYSVWLGGYKLPDAKAGQGAKDAPTSNSPKSGWRWVTGEPWAFTYWSTGEPNNAGGQDNKDAPENRLSADGSHSYTWNDVRDNSRKEAFHLDVLAYVVEYGKAVVVVPAPKKRIVRKRTARKSISAGKPSVR